MQRDRHGGRRQLFGLAADEEERQEEQRDGGAWGHTILELPEGFVAAQSLSAEGAWLYQHGAKPHEVLGVT